MATSVTKRNNRAVVDRVERIVLSQRDTERALKLLEKPLKPTPALLAAARRRRARLG